MSTVCYLYIHPDYHVFELKNVTENFLWMQKRVLFAFDRRQIN